MNDGEVITAKMFLGAPDVYDDLAYHLLENGLVWFDESKLKKNDNLYSSYAKAEANAQEREIGVWEPHTTNLKKNKSCVLS